MSRLRRQVKSYIASLRMTRFDMILFYEGKDNDPTFYIAVCDGLARETGISFDLRRADELPNAAQDSRSGTGGKTTLLRASEFWEKWKTARLIGWIQSKRVFFCVDRDLEGEAPDDAVKGIVRTRLHSVENHLIRGTDLSSALSIAFGFRKSEIQAELPVSDCYTHLAALWRDWTVYCVLALRMKVGVGGYGRTTSPINVPAHCTASPALMAREYEILRGAAQLSDSDFHRLQAEAEAEVDHLLASGMIDSVFKGKWYADILFSTFSSITKFQSQCQSSGKKGIWIGVRARFELSSEDLQYYRERLFLVKSVRRPASGRAADQVPECVITSRAPRPDSRTGFYPKPMTWGLIQYQTLGHTHFNTFSCYKRSPYLQIPAAKHLSEDPLERTRVRYGLHIYGYVIVPEHVHLLLSEPADESRAPAGRTRPL